MKTMRLQKFLAHAGLCSRRKAEEYIVQGRVRVNNAVVTKLGTKIDLHKDIVEFDEKRVRLESSRSKIYIALNKPRNFVTSCARQNSKIVLDLIDIDERVYPVGRLDKDSTGLVLLTNDGNLHLKLSHPSFNHEKEYIVTTVKPIPDSALKKMAEGMVIDGIKTRKAAVKRLSENRFRIILKQGLNRQIRKMTAASGNRVSGLHRIRMSGISIGKITPGHWRYLTRAEIADLTK